jgi:uncharacterized membrane protein
MRTLATLSLLVLAASTAAAPAALAAEPTASAPPAASAETSSAAESVYCLYVGAAGVGSTQLYPGGTYCVPFP